MGKKQKIWLGATVGVLILSLIILTLIFTKTDYEVAFQNLDTTDAAAIMTHLDASGIPYELGANGQTISVPSAVASKVKVDVGSQGLVQNGSIGFESFEQSSSQFGTTENEFNVKYRNALNGEIQQLLNGMQGVQSSNVLVNLPEDSVFLTTEEAERASASIMLKFTGGYRPSQKEVDGYFNLVKTAVPNLAIEDITISSPQGELLPSETNGDAAGNAETVNAQFQIQRKYETDLKKNLQQFLGPIVGSDNLVISVTSSLNFEKRTTKEDLVRPLADNDNNGIIISEEVKSSSSTNTDGASGGVAGTGETDVPGYQAANGSGESASEDNSRITNYDVDRITNNILSSPYVVSDLSISVGVEKDKLDEETRAGFERVLKSVVIAQLAASGQNVNDDVLISKKVSLIAQNFAEGSDSSTSGLSMAWIAGLGIAALAIIGGLIFVIARRRKQAEEEELELSAPAKLEYPTLDIETLQNDSQARKNLETLAKRKPDEFVNLLRTWLVEE